MDSALAVHERIEKEAPCSSDKKTVSEVAVGQGIRQGDLYVIRLNDSGVTTIKGLEDSVIVDDFTLPAGTQLAQGTTMGSRHTIRENEATFWHNPKESNLLVGGVIRAKDRFTIEHPEHADWELPGGTYGVFHQLDFRTKQRVRD